MWQTLPHSERSSHSRHHSFALVIKCKNKHFLKIYISVYILFSAEDDPWRRPLECDLCGKKFSGTSVLAHHRKSHEGYCSCRYKLFTLCTRKCKHSYRNKLSSPILLNDDIFAVAFEKRKPFECDICGQRFTGNHALQQHKLLHLRKLQFWV